VLGALIIPLVAARYLSYWRAIIISTISLSLLLHVITWLSLGYVAPFANVSIPVSIIAFFLWSAGLTWLFRRRWTTKRNGPMEGAEK